MPVIKGCPICASDCQSYFDKDKMKYVIECTECKQKGFIIKLENEDQQKLYDIWNDRAFDKFLLKYPEQSITFLQLLDGENVNIEKVKSKLFDFKFGSLYSAQTGNVFGYLEDLDGNIAVCDNSHIETLLDALDIDYHIVANQSSLDEIVQKVFINNGYIKISTQAKCMMLQINTDKVNKKQIDALFKFIENNSSKEEFRTIKVYYVDLVNKCREESIEVFCSLNDLILFLDKVK